MDLITRVEWHARKPKSFEHLARTRGVKVHYTGTYVNPMILQHHSECYVEVRDIQNVHMNGNGWADIGYSAVVCPHGAVFCGRGPGILPAANGAGLNSDHYAVCGLVGNRGLVVPYPEMLNGIRDAIEWLRDAGNAGDEIKCHKDGYATDCPGRYLTQWVRAGAPRTDDDVSAKDVWEYGIDTGDGKAKWRAGSVLGNLEKTQDQNTAQLAELKGMVKALSAQVDNLTAIVTALQ